jgi:hypothetical protein
MPRHKLTKEQQIKGIKAALNSSKTPKHLLPSLRKRLEVLEKNTSPKLEKKNDL